MTDLILDTNVIVADSSLRGAMASRAWDYLRVTGSHLVVPGLVIEDTVARFRSEVEGESTKYAALSRSFARLGRQLPGLDLDGQQLEADYAKQLRDRLADLQAQVLPYPEIEHAQLARLACARKRPFGANASGYRDALVWFSIAAFVDSSSRDFAFVTNNAAAYWDATKTRLHPDLAGHFTNPSSMGRIVLYRDLQDFWDSASRELEELELLKMFELEFANAAWTEAVTSFLVMESTIVADLAHMVLREISRSGFHDVARITSGPNDVSIGEVAWITGGGDYIAASANYSMSVDLVVTHADWEHSSDCHELVRDVPNGVLVRSNFNVRAQFVLRALARRVQSAEVTSVQVTDAGPSR